MDTEFEERWCEEVSRYPLGLDNDIVVGCRGGVMVAKVIDVHISSRLLHLFIHFPHADFDPRLQLEHLLCIKAILVSLAY